MLIKCPKCSVEVEVTEELVGRKGRCPTCDEKFIIPPLAATNPLPETSLGGVHPNKNTEGTISAPTPVPRRVNQLASAKRGNGGMIIAVVAACCLLAFLIVLSQKKKENPESITRDLASVGASHLDQDGQVTEENKKASSKPEAEGKAPRTERSGNKKISKGKDDPSDPRKPQLAAEPEEDKKEKKPEQRKIRRSGMSSALVSLNGEHLLEYEDEIEPLLDSYCYDCHGYGKSEGNFSMDEFSDLTAHLDNLDHWLPLWENIRSQIMPPSEEDQLEIEEKKFLMQWIERNVFKLDPKQPDPGRVTIRRLNRTEYRNAVYDLLGVEFNAHEFFPPDDTGYGFDNIGDVLSISPLLMEKYVTAAEEVVLDALPKGANAQVPVQYVEGHRFTHPKKTSTTGRWLPFVEKATVQHAPEIRWDGEYEVTLEYQIRGAIDATDQEAQLKVTCDNQALGEELLGWDQRETIELTGRVKLKKGRPTFKVQMTPASPTGPDQEEQAVTLKRLKIRGPLDGEQREYSKGHQMIFVEGEPNGSPKQLNDYAARIMRSFVSRAFRRPIKNQTIDRLVDIVNEIDGLPGKTFEDGIREAIATCLCSPRFLFRIEIQPEPNNPDKVVFIDEYALAARLSFFIWGSVPDDELLSLAFRKELRQNLSAQVDRMLEDPRSERLVDNFVGQWLQTRNLATSPLAPHVVLDVKDRKDAAKIFDVRLLDDMVTETRRFFRYILDEKRPAEELISARYTFLNERLANYYGIAGIKGENFVKVDLTDNPERGGVLTQGSYLIISSNPTRTSPVKRGLFVLDNFLGTPAPPAPPNIPELEEVAAHVGANPTMREMMQIHRDSPDCRGCHARMDPIGLGLENFDALGRYRKQENNKPIDAGGELLTGEKFRDVTQLKKILAGSRKQDFYRCLSEKMLTFAVGRGVEYYDTTTIEELVHRLHQKDGQLRELILGIVESAPFQQRRGTE